MEPQTLPGDIPGRETYVRVEPLNKGWSSDRKFVAENGDGEKFLLRLADAADYDRKKNEFEMMKKVAALGVPMQRPLAFGVCGGGAQVYQVLSWVEGEDAQTALPRLPKARQYALGLEAGRILKRMQSLAAWPPSCEWAKACGEKHRRYLQNYRDCGRTFEGDAVLIRYVERRQYLLENRPMCFSHDDYHLGNLILSPGNALYVIDFQKFRRVDPWHALCGLIFSAQTSPAFAAGQVRGYFDGEPPAEFWATLALHMAALAINFLPWSIPFGQADIDFAYRQIADVLRWYDNMQNIVPSWYAEGKGVAA